MLALDPDAVRLAEAGRGDVRPLPEIMPMLREQGVRAVSANGVLGDPAGACAAEGERLLTRLAAGLDDTLNALLGTRLLHYCRRTPELTPGPQTASESARQVQQANSCHQASDSL
jgi:hypothetical protein